LGAFATIALIDSATGAAWGVTNDASANIIMSNQTDEVMRFLPSADMTVGVAGQTRSLTILGALDSGAISDKVILQNGQLSLVGNSDDTVPPKINFVNNADASNASIAWGNDQLIFDAFQILLNPGGGGNVNVQGDLVISGTIETGNPGGGSGLWLLGDVITAVSTLDTSKYLQVKVGTVVYKIATFS
jgi:hypothetical protein